MTILQKIIMEAIASGSVILHPNSNASLYDWVKEWNNNKTQISDQYLISPNIFSGVKNSDGTLTGVMLTRTNGLPGIYGYVSSKDVFHINSTEAVMAGWKMKENGIQNANGTLRILSEGTIISDGGTASSTVHWALKHDGTATFANGNVSMSADGSATFEGTIKAKSGSIASWNIAETRIYSNGVCIDNKTHSISIEAGGKVSETDDYMSLVKANGGVTMYYAQSSDYGLSGFAKIGTACEKIFSIGSVNNIAGWSFDNNAIWSGTKKNISSQYSSNGITIGSNGLRGTTWYIDTSGGASLASGKIKFSTSESTISGWILKDTSLSSDYIRISNSSTSGGLYLSLKNKIASTSDSGAVTEIKSNGGIYLATKSGNSELYAANTNGKQTFYLTASGTSNIAGWSFDNECMYMNNKCNTSASFATSNGITIGTNGIRTKCFRLEMDGSGAIASDNIKWSASGEIIISSDASLAFVDSLSGSYFSKIDKDGVYTGSLSADNITSGTISTATIKQKDGLWELSSTGSGFLGNNGISWDKDGNITIASGKVGGMKIVGNSITNDGFNNDAYIVLRNDNTDCFAGIGGNVLPASTGTCAVARFENHYDGGYLNETWFQEMAGVNYGLVVSAKRARRNIAIEINNGCISGMAIRTETITSNMTINRELNVAITFSNDAVLNLTLPTMKRSDDGHVLIICNQGSYGGTLYAGENYVDDASEESKTTRNSFLSTPSNESVRLMYIEKGRTRYRLVYCHYFTTTLSGEECGGSWIVL